MPNDEIERSTNVTYSPKQGWTKERVFAISYFKTDMTVGELRKILADPEIPDSAYLRTAPETSSECVGLVYDPVENDLFMQFEY